MVMATEATCSGCGQTFMQGDCHDLSGLCYECIPKEPITCIPDLEKVNTKLMKEVNELREEVEKLKKENKTLKTFAGKITDGLLGAVKWLEDQEFK